MPRSPNRRQFLSAALVGLTPKSGYAAEGAFVDDSVDLGHRLRDRPTSFPSPTHQVRIPTVIVGGGVAGLSAAWRLDKRGYRDFVLLELEPQAGGNARSGENEVSAYPWAAHYVPVPDKHATLVRELMEELGVLHDGVWEERDLCFSPKERLFLHGRWQDGIEPELGATREDHNQYRRFQDTMAELGANGEFRIPMQTGARKRTDLDRISMREWMVQNRFDSPYLNWLIDYSCRDDFGAHDSATSAWAGIHYFAARLEHEETGPLTWPEGNGWIVKRLLSKLSPYVRTGAFVHAIRPEGNRVRVLTDRTEYLAEHVIFAAPTFLAGYLIEGCPRAEGFEYSPWLTANLTLDHWPQERGLPVAWDNVIYRSPALGYVVATHQSLRTFIDKTVWTFYWSLVDGTPAEMRALLLSRSWNDWKEAILNDLQAAHPDIRSAVTRVDIMRMGHAMIRPATGFLFSGNRTRWLQPFGRVVFANSDLSGLSLFEEAQYRGVAAADHILQK